MNKMRGFEQVPYEVAKDRMLRAPSSSSRCLDTLKGSGIQRSRLVARELRRGSKYSGFAHFSATLPLELVKLIISLVATSQSDLCLRGLVGENMEPMFKSPCCTPTSVVHTLMLRAKKRNTFNCHRSQSSTSPEATFRFTMVTQFLQHPLLA